MTTIDGIEYERLPGRNFGSGLRHKGFVGPEYILALEEYGYTQFSRWIALRDVQSIVIRYTAGRMWINVALLPFVVCMGLIATACLGWEMISAIIMWSVTGVFAACMAINTLRGRACRLHVQTAVRSTCLTFACREATAKRVLEILRQRIAPAQADLAAKLSAAAPAAHQPAQGVQA